MKTLLTSLLLTITFLTNAQLSLNHYLNQKPVNISSNTDELQYNVELKWQNLDALNGTKFNCNMATAEYTVKPSKGTAVWGNVYLGKIPTIQENLSKGQKLNDFDNWEYKIHDTTFLQEEFYSHLPANQHDLAKWLVCDAIQMQGLALYVFDSLQFNQTFTPKLLNDYDINFENWVTFSSRYQKLLWSGITKINNEVCAIVKFESFYNPVSAEKEGMKFQGRSLYWGEMWISLEDKQVEYASMVEDVILELDSPAFPKKQLIDLQREIIFEKVQ